MYYRPLEAGISVCFLVGGSWLSGLWWVWQPQDWQLWKWVKGPTCLGISRCLVTGFLHVLGLPHTKQSRLVSCSVWLLFWWWCLKERLEGKEGKWAECCQNCARNCAPPSETTSLGKWGETHDATLPQRSPLLRVTSTEEWNSPSHRICPPRWEWRHYLQ